MPPFPTGWSGDNFALQDAPSGDLTDQIKQGIDGTSVMSGKLVKVDFQYINMGTGARAGHVYVYGLNAGASWSVYAPWLCAGGGGCTLLYEASLPTTATWTPFSGSFTPGSAYAAVAIGITLGGPASLSRGVDDVSLSQNQPPDCSGATPSVATLWPPNHQFVPIDILGVTDPDGDDVTIQVTFIEQDEPVNDPGSGNTSPDGQGVGTATAEVRAERAGNGDGRVYHIGFEADDGDGGTCDGTVTVSVPKSQGPNGAAVDEGALYDSTTP